MSLPIQVDDPPAFHQGHPPKNHGQVVRLCTRTWLIEAAEHPFHRTAWHSRPYGLSR
jgi:hypothetical protein